MELLQLPPLNINAISYNYYLKLFPPGEKNSVGFHSFGDEEINNLRAGLLTWYDDNKRDLPWRDRVRHLMNIENQSIE